MPTTRPISKPDEFDVAIIGYGPTGVTAANFLGQYGIRTVIIEREREIYPRARAVTVDDFTLRLFQAVGLDAELLDSMDQRIVLRWKTYAGKELLRITPTEIAPFGQPASTMIFQPVMEASLRSGADRFAAFLDIRYGQQFVDLEQDAEGVTVTNADVETGETSTIRARYVIGCDGGSSRVRERLGVRMNGKSHPQQWVVVDTMVKKWWPGCDTCTFWSDPIRPVVDIPLALNHHRWEFPIAAEDRERFARPEALWELLATLGVTSDNVDILHHAFYLHHVLEADRWRIGRVLLAGDAAHMMPPWAGQGMQSGIRDAHNLAWKLRQVLSGALSDSLLDTYQEERAPHVAEMTNLALGMGVLIEAHNPVVVAARNNLLPLVKYLPFLGRYVGEFRFKPLPSIKSGFLSSPRRGNAVGKMLPQPLVARANGERLLLDDVIGDGFAVLGLDCDPRSVLSATDRQDWERLGARFITICSTRRAHESTSDIIDFTDTLAPWFKKHRTSVIAVRPDRFVAASADRTGLHTPMTALHPDLHPTAKHAAVATQPA